MAVATTEYSHIIEFLIDGIKVSQWECNDSHVAGAPALSALTVDIKSMRRTQRDVEKWNLSLQSGAWGVSPDKDFLTTPYATEISWSTGTTALHELSIGDLVWELLFDTVSEEYTLTRSAFDLSWADYVWFVDSWRKFLFPGA